jgi:hypothetical protein
MWFTARNLNLFRRLRSAAEQEAPSLRTIPPKAADAAVDPATPSQLERRQSPRRWSDPIEVFVRGEMTTAEPARGWVKNRSAGGLCISVSQPVAEGMIIEVRFTLAPDTIPWVRAQVKGCRSVTGRWMLHCQYLGVPSPEAVLLFR